MDPVSQGLIGACFAGAISKKNEFQKASVLGAIGGIIPDIDIFIKSNDDPLLFLEYHRHFTHSFFFVPIGSFFLAGFIFVLLKNFKLSFKRTYIYLTLGFLSHGILDSCTSYGTNLLWPFYKERISWNLISIIDPIFTIFLCVFFILFLIKKKRVFIHLGLLICFSYLGINYIKKENIKNYIFNLAKKRNHEIERILIKPTFGNNILWRSIYQSDQAYFIDAVFIPFFSVKKDKQGKKIDVIDKNTVFPEIPIDAIQRKDIIRFSYFSQDYIYLHPDYNNVIADLRYSSLPYDHKSLWGIEVNPDKYNEHVNFRNFRDFENKFYKRFLRMLRGNF